MSIQTTKAALWVGSMALFGGLGYTVYEFVETRKVDSVPLSAEEYEPFLTEVEKPEPPKDDLVDYDKVLATFHQLDWTGTPPPPPRVETKTDEGPKVVPKIAVSTLVEVLMTQVDSLHPERSTAYLHLLKPQMVANSPTKENKVVFTVGDALPKPHDDVLIERIDPGVVVFSFADEAREHEDVGVKSPDDDMTWIVKLGENDEVLVPEEDKKRIGQLEGVFRPKQTYMRRSGVRTQEWVIGSDDRELWANGYSEILANDVSYRRHRDPRTGKVDGVEITDVAPNSIAARHGVESGMIVKSVNGHAVTSVSDAIAYAKQNANTTSTWIIVYMKQGKEYTTTYQSD